MLARDVKCKLIDEYKVADNDTGSVDVQVAILTKRINSLISHFDAHKKDNHSRRGLIHMVNKRKSLINYLKDKDSKRYSELVSKLGLRK